MAYKFEAENPHIHLHSSFKNNLAKILKQNIGTNIGEIFAKNLNEFAGGARNLKSLDDLLEFIENFPMSKTILKPIAYKDAGCFNSDDKFYEFRFIRGEGDKYFGAIGVFFPVLFEKENLEDLKHICVKNTDKNTFGHADIYFATYRD